MGFLLTARAVQGRVGPTALFALPLAYGFPFQFGFVNYALSMALAFLAFAGWLTLGDRGRVALRAALFVPVGFLVWLAHVYGCGVLGLLAFSAEFHRLWRGGRPWWRALAEAPLHCLPLVPPAILMVLWRAGDRAGGTGGYFEWTNKGRWIIDALRDRWELFDLASVGVLLLVLALVLPLAAWGRWARFGPRLTLGALAMAAAFVLMPRIVFGSNYADMRMVPFVLAALLLSIRVEQHRLAQWVALAGAAFFAVRIGATTVSYALYDADTDRQLRAVEHMPDGARVVALVGNDCSDLGEARSRLSPAVDRGRAPPRLRERPISTARRAIAVGALSRGRPFVTDPSQIVTPRRCGGWRTVEQALARLPFGGFDQLWLMDIDRARWPRDPRLRLVWRFGESALYDVVSAGAPPPAGTRRRAGARDRPDGASHPNTVSSRRLTRGDGIRSSLSSCPRHRPTARAAAIGGNSRVLKWVSRSTRSPARSITSRKLVAV